jgi:hypothetical protein
MTYLACCSFGVSVKLSWSMYSSGIRAVFVRSRCLSTLFNSFWTHSAAPGTIGASLCGLESNWVTKVWLSSPFSSRSDSLSSYSFVMCRMNALPSGLRFLLLVKALAYCVNWFELIVASTARNGGPLMNFVLQFISGLNAFSQGYPRIRRSHPRSAMINLIIRDVSPWNTAMGSQCLISPPQLSDPSTFLIPMGWLSSNGLTPSFFAVQMSMQFSFAPQSTRAFSWIIPLRVTNSSGSQTSLAM